MNNSSVYLPDEASTEWAGTLLAQVLPQAATIFLQGDLGAGKTTFSRGFIHGLGYVGAVKSPTYTLVEPYQLSNCTLYHFDLYRLADPEELEYLGIDDYLEQGNYRLIEWPERGQGWLPQPDLLLELLEEQSGRRLVLSASEKPFESVVTGFIERFEN